MNVNNDSKTPKYPKFIQLFCTIFFGLAGMALLYCAIFMPPKGEIHPTVLAAYGMTLAWIGTAIGVDYNYRLKRYYDFHGLLGPQNKAPRKSAGRKPAPSDSSNSLNLNKND